MVIIIVLIVFISLAQKPDLNLIEKCVKKDFFVTCNAF